MNSRRGVSLVELLVFMSACTALLTLMGVLLHRAMRIEMQSRAHASAERTVTRLSEQFRSDVHQTSAIAAKTDSADRVFLRMKLANGRVAEYSRTSGAVLRTESGGTRPTWREEFTFPGTEQLTIERKPAPERLVLTILVRPTEQPSTDSKALTGPYFVPISLCAEAVLGRDLRFVATTANQEAKR